MLSLLIIADDFTGALDTGVQFASTGLRVKVTTDIESDFLALHTKDVLVMDTETRHCSAKQAYERVYRVAERAAACKVPYILKKTDSGLRGNIGSELTALLDTTERNSLPFIPAFPRMKRTTVGGRQYFNGVLVEQSVFGKDPFNPVTASYIPDIIRQQSGVPVVVMHRDQPPMNQICQNRIEVYDAESDEEIRQIAEKLFSRGELEIMAGCAGLASVLPNVLQLRGTGQPVRLEQGGLFIINGSLNPVTAAQLKEAARRGIPRIPLQPEQKLEQDYWDTDAGRRTINDIFLTYQRFGCCIVDTIDSPGDNNTEVYTQERKIPLDQLVKRIPETLGVMAKKILTRDEHMVPMVIGGDTLRGILGGMGVSEMEPICEIVPGTVLSVFVQKGNKRQILSKSGGFGEETILVQIERIFSATKKQK